MLLADQMLLILVDELYRNTEIQERLGNKDLKITQIPH